MFVKPKTGFQKLLDKKSLRTAAYGDSKGLKFFKKFKRDLRVAISFAGCLLLFENSLIGVDET